MFENLMGEWVGLAGVAALIALLINVGKTAGVIKDGQAGTVSAGLNLLGLAGLLALKVFAPDTSVIEIDTQLSRFAEVGLVLLTYISQLLVSKGAHLAVKGVPVIGKSFDKTGKG